jgi:Tfp pilus assembly protein PilX
VLPTTLLVTTLLTVMLTAAFILVTAEYRTTDNSLANTRALTLAQAGLQTYLAANRALTTSSTYDSTRFTLTGGYADVVAQRLYPQTDTTAALWIVRSSGYSTVATQSGVTQGKRVVAQLAEFNPGVLPARAAMVAANGVNMTSNGSNPISGDNLDLSCAVPAPDYDTTGLTVPVGGYVDSAKSGQRPAPAGGVEYLNNATAVLDSTRIDWSALLAGNFTPDYTIPTNPWPPVGGQSYQVGYAGGDVTIPGGGMRRGMIVVTGNVTMAAGAHWDGIIIAGGRFGGVSSASSYTVHGMVITGLNVSLGQNVPVNIIRRNSGGGSRTIRWTTCYAVSSTASLASLVPVKHSWMDTWSTY